MPEVAARLGVKRETVEKWRTRHLFPEARWTVGGGPAWDWPTIEAWATATGRNATD